MKNELICGFLAKMQKTCDYIRAKKEMIRLDFFSKRVGFKNNAFQSSEKSILKALVKPLCANPLPSSLFLLIPFLPDVPPGKISEFFCTC